MIYGLGTDGIVHSYLTRTLQACPSLPSPSSTVASLQFTYKLATSPCGRWLATGSADGRAYLYDISSHHTAHEQAPVALHGHKEHVMGLNWANSEVVRLLSHIFLAVVADGHSHPYYSLRHILTTSTCGYGGLTLTRPHGVGRTRRAASNRQDWKWAGSRLRCMS
jgi:WD40 repeat protein